MLPCIHLIFWEFFGKKGVGVSVCLFYDLSPSSVNQSDVLVFIQPPAGSKSADMDTDMLDMTVQCRWSVSFQPCGNRVSVVLAVLDAPWWRCTLQWMENALDVLEGQISQALHVHWCHWAGISWQFAAVCSRTAWLVGVFRQVEVYGIPFQEMDYRPTWRDNKLKPLLIIALTEVFPIYTCITHKSTKTVLASQENM